MRVNNKREGRQHGQGKREKTEPDIKQKQTARKRKKKQTANKCRKIVLTNWFIRNNADQTDICYKRLLQFPFRFVQLLTM